MNLLACSLSLILAWSAPAPACAQDELPPTQELEADLAKHIYFKQVKWTRHEEPAVALYIQKPALPNEYYAPRLVKFYGPWIGELASSFREEYVTPTGLVRRPTTGEGAVPPLSLMILATEGDYLNYSKRARIYGEYSDLCVYDPGLGMVVTFEDPTTRLPDNLKRSHVLSTIVHALLHRYSDVSRKDGAATSGSLWFHEGLANYLSHHVARKPEGLRDRPIYARSARYLYELLASPKERRVYVPELGFLLSAANGQAIAAPAKGLAKEEGLEFDPWKHYYGLHQKFYALVHFLHEAQDGHYRDRSVRFLGEVLRGKKGDTAFREVFEGVSIADIEARLPNYLNVSLGGSPADVPLPVSVDDSVSADVAPDLSLLSLRPEERDARVAAAVERAMSGDLERALAELDALESEVEKDSLVAQRVNAEILRIRAFQELRDGYFEELIQSGERLSLEHQGERLRARVSAIKDGVVVFKKATRGLEGLPLREIELVQLAGAIGSKSSRFAAPWVRLYPYCATVNEKWKKLCSRVDGPEAEALAKDAERVYPSLIARGRAARGLTDLVDAGLPQDPSAASETIDRMTALVATYGSFPVVETRRAALARLARHAFGMRFDSLPLADLLSGKVTETGDDGLVRIEYEFVDATHSGDWVQDDLLLLDWHKKFRPLSYSGADFGLKENGLRGAGAAALAHVLEFEPPLRYRVEATWGDDPRLTQPSWHLVLGACLDAKGNHAYWDALNTLCAYDATTRSYDQKIVEDGPAMYSGERYSLELVVEGGTAKSLIGTKEAGTVPATTCKRGKLFFWVHSDLTVVVHRAVIEGRVSSEGKKALRLKWIEDGLSRMGLPP